ncbi:MAG: dTDP-4-dehydrorhamnose 3,5-epimerase [Chthoniobacteraceae bacterium]
MKFSAARLTGVFVIDLELREDERGFFARTYCEKEFSELGLNTRWPQCNISFSKARGILRGLHFQKEPVAEIKLVRCLSGVIFDVVVDIRPASPTFGDWEAFELSGANRRSLYIPPGFAHGLQCLSDTCEVSYQMGEYFVPDQAAGVRWDDPEIGISWPLKEPIISSRDACLPLLSEIL